MNRLLLFVLTLLLSTVDLYSNDSIQVNSEKKDSTHSRYAGFYKAGPILDISEREKLNKKKLEIELEIQSTLSILSAKIAADTVLVPSHMSFLRGRITIPKLSAEQKDAKRIKQEIEKYKTKIQNLENELNEVMALIRKDEQFYVKSLFWGLVFWEVKKAEKQIN